jgi:hypothetical protein
MRRLLLAWRLAKGYRLTPWRSPYLRWRIETYSGLHAESLTQRQFLSYCWTHRRELWRYLGWATTTTARPGRTSK